MARSLDGSTQYLLGTAPVTAYPWSASFWIRPANVTSELVALSLGKNSGATANLWDVRVEGAVGDAAAIYSFPGPQVTRTTNVCSANTWHHVAVIATSATSRTVVLDGNWASRGTGTTSSSPTGVDTVAIGCQWYNLAAYLHFNGRICEVGIYSVSLTQADVESLADGFTPLSVCPQSLSAYYPLGGHYGQLDVDRWKNRYDLTPTGSPTWADHPRVIYPRRSFWVPSPSVAGPPSSTKYSWWAWNTFGTPLDHDARG